MDAYKSVIGSTNENLTNGDTIYWNNLRKIIVKLADTEDKLMMEEYQS